MTENPRLWSIESREMSKRAKVAAEASNYRHQQRNPNVLDPRPLATNALTSILASTNMATVTSLRETIALQMMVTTKRLPLPILSARHMHPHPRHLILRQNLFLWPTTRNLHTSHPK